MTNLTYTKTTKLLFYAVGLIYGIYTLQYFTNGSNAFINAIDDIVALIIALLSVIAITITYCAVKARKIHEISSRRMFLNISLAVAFAAFFNPFSLIVLTLI